MQKHNREIIASAEDRAEQMKVWPSKLEEMMQEFLEKNWIMHETQKVFYIKEEDGWISKYYIADFFIPRKNLIIEVDGKFHNKQKLHDKNRTKDIQKSYPGVEVVRYTWKDMFDNDRMAELLEMVS